MLSLKNIYNAYWARPKDDGSVDLDRRLLGKLVIHEGNVDVLSDYHGFFGDLPKDGKIDTRTERTLDRLFHSSYIDMVSKDDVYSGRRADLLPETILPPGRPILTQPPDGGPIQPDAPALVSAAIEKPPSIFDYQRAGMDEPHTVEIVGGQVLLDGNVLKPEEVQVLLSNVQNGAATLRYKHSPIQKMEAMLIDLQKAETLGDSMEQLKALVAAGHLKPEHFDTIRRELYQDEMVPSIGNKRAYREHLENEGRGGVHVMLDANDFKSINDELSHEHGDQAIKAMGGALRNAVDKTVGAQNAKIHRFGGDEFHVHVPTHEHAAQFLRGLRQELENVPPVGGTHKLSMSAGIGTSPQTADAALNHGAKEQKKAAIAALGGDPTARVGRVRAPHALYAHSAVPGHEGPIPTGHDQLPLKAPEVPKVTPLHAEPKMPAAPPSQPSMPAVK